MLDTSTVILLAELSDPSELPDESVVSAITLAELSVGPHVAHDDAERSARRTLSLSREGARLYIDTPPEPYDRARSREGNVLARPHRTGRLITNL